MKRNQESAIYVVVHRDDPEREPVAVWAESYSAAAQQVVGAGPYDFAKEPRNWDGDDSVIARVQDDDGLEFECEVFGPFDKRGKKL